MKIVARQRFELSECFLITTAPMLRPTALHFGVPPRSVLGPILFLLYTVDLIGSITRHDLRPHLYADDTQVYGSCPPPT